MKPFWLLWRFDTATSVVICSQHAAVIQRGFQEKVKTKQIAIE